MISSTLRSRSVSETRWIYSETPRTYSLAGGTTRSTCSATLSMTRATLSTC
jgi:hypothetical protein